MIPLLMSLTTTKCTWQQIADPCIVGICTAISHDTISQQYLAKTQDKAIYPGPQLIVAYLVGSWLQRSIQGRRQQENMHCFLPCWQFGTEVHPGQQIVGEHALFLTLLAVWYKGPSRAVDSRRTCIVSYLVGSWVQRSIQGSRQQQNMHCFLPCCQLGAKVHPGQQIVGEHALFLTVLAIWYRGPSRAVDSRRTCIVSYIVGSWVQRSIQCSRQQENMHCFLHCQQFGTDVHPGQQIVGEHALFLTLLAVGCRGPSRAVDSRRTCIVSYFVCSLVQRSIQDSRQQENMHCFLPRWQFGIEVHPRQQIVGEHALFLTLLAVGCRGPSSAVDSRRTCIVSYLVGSQVQRSIQGSRQLENMHCFLPCWQFGAEVHPGQWIVGEHALFLTLLAVGCKGPSRAVDSRRTCIVSYLVGSWVQRSIQGSRQQENIHCFLPCWQFGTEVHPGQQIVGEHALFLTLLAFGCRGPSWSTSVIRAQPSHCVTDKVISTMAHIQTVGTKTAINTLCKQENVEIIQFFRM